jgi:four helix bundle protein
MAMGSASEAEYHLLLARDLELIDPVAYKDLAVRVTEVKRMLAMLIGQLSKSRRNPTRPVWLKAES